MDILWEDFSNEGSSLPAVFYGYDLHCCINKKEACKPSTDVRLFVADVSPKALPFIKHSPSQYSGYMDTHISANSKYNHPLFKADFTLL